MDQDTIRIVYVLEYYSLILLQMLNLFDIIRYQEMSFKGVTRIRIKV